MKSSAILKTKTAKVCAINCLFLSVAVLLYLLYAALDVFAFAIAFSVTGFVQVIAKVYSKKLVGDKANGWMWLLFDSTAMVLLALPFAIVTAATGSFDFDYGDHIILNVVFVFYILQQIWLDVDSGPAPLD